MEDKARDDDAADEGTLDAGVEDATSDETGGVVLTAFCEGDAEVATTELATGVTLGTTLWAAELELGKLDEAAAEELAAGELVLLWPDELAALLLETPVEDTAELEAGVEDAACLE